MSKKLYQEMIIEHNKNPRNFGPIENPTQVLHGKNPLCGDDYYLFIRVQNKIVEDISFQGDGCAISKSSASLMTDIVKGKPYSEIEPLLENFITLVTSDKIDENTLKSLGKLKVFEGVKDFPVRVKCATLIWRTLESALKGETNHDITTE